MTPAESPPADGPHGPPVADEEGLYRCIAYPKQLGCDVRLESDPLCPQNAAHAHVYMPQDKRKIVARKLVEASIVVRRPSFGDASPSY